ncbi:MAG: hypothetical protein WC584_05585 [Candidatus Pacearchaeota archaeon]
MVWFFSTDFYDKQGQVWSLDVIVGITIFMAAMVILFFYAMNYTNQSEINMEDLSYQGNIASEFILSEQHGILTSNKINQTKLDSFYYSDYGAKKSELGVKDNFYFTLTDLEINGTFVDYVGKMNETDVKNVIQVTRFTIYKNKPVQFNIFIWG